jgi:PAS domain S-box-containing protein
VLDDLAQDPVLQALPVAAVVTDNNGLVVAWNHQAEVLYGWRADEVIGHAVTDISDQVDDVFAAMAGEGAVLNLPLQRRDGTVVMANGTATPIRDADGRVVGLLRLAEDVTGKRLGSAVHAETAERIRLAIDAGRLGTWEYDARTGSMHISARFEEILGLRPGGFGGTLEALITQVHPDDRPLLASARGAALEQDNVIQIEYRIVRPTGQMRWVEGRGHLRVANGEVAGSIGVVMDVTDRRLAEHERDALAATLNLHARSIELLAELDVGRRLQVLADVLVPQLAECCAVHLLDADASVRVTAVKHAVAARTEAFRELMQAFPVTLDQPYGAGAVLASGRPQFLPQVSDDVLQAVTNTSEQLEEFRELQLRSSYVAPLLSRGRALGAISLGRTDDRPWTEADRLLVDQIATAAAIAVDNAQLYSAERQARDIAERNERRLRLLAEVTNALSRTLDLDDVVTALADLLIPGQGEMCLIDVLDDDGRPGLVSVSGVHPDSVELMRAAEQISPRWRNRDTAMAQCLRSGQPVMLARIDDDYLAQRAVDVEQLRLYLDMRLVSGAVAPMTARGRVVGAISLFGVGPAGHIYRSDDADLLAEIGQRAGLAVDNARLYSREHAVAEALQRSLLPDLKPLPGLDVAARYLPSSEHAQVGGDWFDAFAVADDAVGIAVGDAMGHDPRASGAMGQLRSVLRSYAFEGAAPAVVLDKLDRLIQEFSMAQLATVLYGRLDPADPHGRRLLRYCSAGHPPALLRRAAGALVSLDQAQSVVIGATDPAGRHEADLLLEPGDLLVCFTDGLVEGRDREMDEGVALLRDTLQRLPARADADSVCDAVLAALAPDDRDDDIALLAVRLVNADG